MKWASLHSLLAERTWLPGPGKGWQDTKTFELAAIVSIAVMIVGLARGTIRSCRPDACFRQSMRIAVFYAVLFTACFLFLLLCEAELIRAWVSRR